MLTDKEMRILSDFYKLIMETIKADPELMKWYRTQIAKQNKKLEREFEKPSLQIKL